MLLLRGRICQKCSCTIRWLLMLVCISFRFRIGLCTAMDIFCCDLSRMKEWVLKYFSNPGISVYEPYLQLCTSCCLHRCVGLLLCSSWNPLFGPLSKQEHTAILQQCLDCWGLVRPLWLVSHSDSWSGTDSEVMASAVYPGTYSSMLPSLLFPLMSGLLLVMQ